MTKLKVKTPSKATPKKNNKEVAKSPAITPSKLTQKSPKKQKTPESRKRASKAAELVEDVSILKKKAKKEKNGWKKQPEPEKESDSAEDAASVNDVKEDIDSDEESDIEMTNANGGLNEDAENSDVEEDSEGEDEEDSEAENEKANGEEASEEELYDTSTISVKPIRSMTSPEIIKEYFAKCGQITNCQLIVNPNTKKQKALITFQDVDEAKLAVATLSGSLFQHYKIKVQLVQTSCGFAEDGSILIKNLPQDTGIQSSEVLDYAKDALTKSFGPVKDLLLSSDMLQATVQFEDKAAATAALAAGSFQLLGCKVDIVPYGDAATPTVSPDIRVVISGKIDDVTEEDIFKAISKLCDVTPETVGQASKTHITIGVESEENVVHLLGLKTLKVKKINFDILPDLGSKHFYNPVTKVYGRHPAGVFVENLKVNMGHWDKYNALSVFGPVQHLNSINNNHSAIAIYEKKSDAQKLLLAEEIYIKHFPVSVKAVDGVYKPVEKPKYEVGNTVYITDNVDPTNVTKVMKQINIMKLPIIRIVESDNFFKPAFFVEFENADDAQKFVDATIEIDGKAVHTEFYDPAKHDKSTVPEGIVLVQNLKLFTEEVDLWKAFHDFGKIANVKILINGKQQLRCAFVEFKEAAGCKKAVEAKEMDVKGSIVTISVPTTTEIDELRKKMRLNSHKLYNYVRYNRLDAPGRGGFKPFRGSFATRRGSFSPRRGGFMPSRGGFKPSRGGRGFAPIRGGGRMATPTRGGGRMATPTRGGGRGFGSARGGRYMH